MPYSKEFGDIVREHMAGRNYHEVATGIDVHYTTLYGYARGNAPSDLRPVEKLADKLKLTAAQKKKLLSAANPPKTAEEILGAGLVELAQEFGRPIRAEFGPDMAEFTPDEARAWIADLRQQLEEGLI